MKITDKIWSKNAELFMRVKHTSQQRVLHPTIAKLINIQNPNKLLDFGCGDGRLIKLLNKNILVDIYDKNIEMVELAQSKLEKRVSKVFKSITEINKVQYDAIILSMVLVCIDNEDEYYEVLKKIKEVKSETGKLYVSVTHPCFRDRKFSNFRTSYGTIQTYNYFNEGEPFNVYIEDEMPPNVAFTDFHWSLSYTINSFIKAGFIIDEMIELKDDVESKFYNRNFPGFIIFTLK